MVKVYYANVNSLESDDIFGAQLRRVCSLRKDKVLRCRHKEDQLRSLMAGLLVRHALENENLSYDDAVFSINSHGKVLVENTPYPVWISISHSGDFAAAAISDVKMGMDIEQERIVKSEERMKQICFTEKEWELDDPFVRIWTRKEAYLKMLGAGMTMEMKEIDTLAPGIFNTICVERDYWISVCAQKPQETVSYTRVEVRNV